MSDYLIMPVSDALPVVLENEGITVYIPPLVLETEPVILDIYDKLENLENKSVHSEEVIYNNYTGLEATNVQDAITELDIKLIPSLLHLNDTANPHQVTKAQVGLGNVDDTSDINKPVSTAQQAALNLKVNTADIINTLGSTETTKPLSAAQGKVLKDIIDTKEFGAVFNDIKLMIDYLNGATATEIRTGFNLYILQLSVPDFWVASSGTYQAYTYTTDSSFIEQIKVAPVRIGYYTISLLETAKVDLTDYVQKSTTIAGLSLLTDITAPQLKTAINSLDASSIITSTDIDALFGGV